ncbi:HAD family hydrolase [Limibacillus halophilus]|uniref:phosphoglycolate phosphatase n=1 Tax=Limibacillus halophilus TaxID=1579333 RepID=A0A839ST82_9PROT|nr:HAD family hydrolase [Limibacillus halophilus]MBB3064920.1 phosphoglycolate phosphatase [Limibacillus halophilus]
MKIKGILFDKDGTLIDFHATWNHAYQCALEDLVGADLTLVAELMAITGYDVVSGRFRAGSLGAASTTREIAEAWLPRVSKGMTLDELVDWMDDRFVRHASNGAVALTDLPALLAFLRRSGLVIGVATSDSEAGAKATLAYFGCSDLVDFVAGYDSGHGIKPGPGMALGFSRACGLAPSEIAVVGDNLHDMEMAQAAGAGLRIAVLSGTGEIEALRQSADHVLPDVSHLPELLNSFC